MVTRITQQNLETEFRTQDNEKKLPDKEQNNTKEEKSASATQTATEQTRNNQHKETKRSQGLKKYTEHYKKNSFL